MSESAVEQNDGSAVLRAVTTVIYAPDTGRIRDKRDAVRTTSFIFYTKKAQGAHSSRTHQTSNVSPIRNW